MKQDKILAFFPWPALASVVQDAQWMRQLHSIITCVETAQPSHYVTEAVAALYKNKPLFKQALILHGLRELISHVHEPLSEFNDDDDDECQFLAQYDFLNEHAIEEPATLNLKELLPQIKYVISEDEDQFSENKRTIEVIVDDQIAAIIKPGELRQQSDWFLSKFYQMCKEKLHLPAQMPDIFIASHPCHLKFSDLETAQNLTRDSEFVVSARTKRIPTYMHIPLQRNFLFDGSAFGGGIQAFLQPTPPKLAPEIQRTIFLFFVCLLGCRDLKSDGIIGATIIDCEDYLEEKKGCNEEEPFPKIHVPFTKNILEEPLDQAMLLHLLEQLQQLDLYAFHQFVAAVHYESPKFIPEYYKDKKDLREEYRVAQPDYQDNRLLSREQVQMLLDNIECLKQTLQAVTQLPCCNVYQFLKTFDPVWSEERDKYITIYLAGFKGDKKYLAFFAEEQKEELEQTARMFAIRDPEELAGSYSSKSTPTPLDGWKYVSSSSGFLTPQGSRSSPAAETKPEDAHSNTLFCSS